MTFSHMTAGLPMPDQHLHPDLQYFDPKEDYSVAWRRLPHWTQAGTICFITWRTADSLPKAAIQRLFQKRQQLLTQHGFEAEADWKLSLAKAPLSVREELHWSFFEAWDIELGKAAGACWLREPDLSSIVMDSLRKFDGDRYVLTDAVIMPNHVHCMVAFRTEDALLHQCTAWKRYTATQINRWLKERSLPVLPKGEFWQTDQFDHLVRNEEYFLKFRRYIQNNPACAGLPEGQFRHYSTM